MPILKIRWFDEINEKLDLIIERLDAIKETRYIHEDLERLIKQVAAKATSIDKQVPDKTNQGK